MINDLSGRNDLVINTQCFEIYLSLKGSKQTSTDQWKELCYLWSSDFRTHITDDRWKIFEARLQKFHREVHPATGKVLPKHVHQIRDIPFNLQHKQVNENERFLLIQNEQNILKLNKKKGLAIEDFFSKEVSGKSLFGTLAHGYYDDIAFGADFFSGHAVIERIGRHKTTDLCKPKISITHDDKDIHICSEVTTDNISLNTKLSLTPSMLIIEKEISLPERQPETIRPLHFTFDPESFNAKTLFYATNNGGKDLEYFNLQGSNIQHHQIY